MPIDPTVCAIMLTRDRPDYARRAVECWRAQTYANKRLLILDTGNESAGYFGDYDGVTHHWADLSLQAWVIGRLRNEAIDISRRGVPADIIIHADDDDYSHPNRIAEQVALLQASGADCVGYREMIFWREGEVLDMCSCSQAEMRDCPKCGGLGKIVSAGESYLYSNPDPSYCLGTSLCYWRRTWERNPFSERNGPNPRERGEDREFLRGIKSLGVKANNAQIGFMFGDQGQFQVANEPCDEPRMIARIHAGNAKHYEIASAGTSNSWRRAPEFDEYCRGVMA